MCTHIVCLTSSSFYTGSQVVVVSHGKCWGVLSAVSRHEGQTFWKNFVYWVCVVYIRVGLIRTTWIPDKSGSTYEPYPYGSCELQCFKHGNPVEIHNGM